MTTPNRFDAYDEPSQPLMRAADYAKTRLLFARLGVFVLFFLRRFLDRPSVPFGIFATL